MTNVNNLRGWTQLHVELSVQISWPGILGEVCEYFNRMDLHYFGSTTVSVLLFFPKGDNLHNLLHIANPKILWLTNFGGKHINPLIKVNYPHMFEYITKLTQKQVYLPREILHIAWRGLWCDYTSVKETAMCDFYIWFLHQRNLLGSQV